MLDRLIAVDAALAGSGLNRRAMARRFRVSPKTIQRDHELLRAVTGDMGLYSQTADGVLHWYTHHQRRVFTRWVTDRRRNRRARPWLG